MVSRIRPGAVYNLKGLTEKQVNSKRIFSQRIHSLPSNNSPQILPAALWRSGQIPRFLVAPWMYG